MAGVAISYDWSEIVNVGHFLSFLGADLPSSIKSSPVVKLLCLEKPLHLIWYGTVGIISKIGRHLIRSGK